MGGSARDAPHVAPSHRPTSGKERIAKFACTLSRDCLAAADGDARHANDDTSRSQERVGRNKGIGGGFDVPRVGRAVAGPESNEVTRLQCRL